MKTSRDPVPRLRSTSFRLRDRTESNPVPFPLGNGVDRTKSTFFGWNEVSWNEVDRTQTQTLTALPVHP